MESYFIKEGYKCNLDEYGHPHPWKGSLSESASYQIDVYTFAAQLIKSAHLGSCLDVGCGHGYKLLKLIYPICPDITGVDREHAISYCKDTYSFGQWYVDDLENPRFPIERKYELIISSDVIEHLAEPNHLLNYIKHFSAEKTHIIISTPERDLIRGFDNFGPPSNYAHVREWNRKEFRLYLESQNFTVESQFLVQDMKASFRQILERVRSGIFSMPGKTCQVCVCKIGRGDGM